METYCGYTVEEIREMESNGTLPQHVLIDYVNGDPDGGDE